MSLNIADKIFLAVGLIDFAGIFFCLGFALYLYHTKMDEMLDHFKNSRSVAPPKYGGPLGKIRAVMNIASFLSFPSLRKYSGAREEDIDNFPPQLKGKLVMLYWGVIGLLLVMVALAAVVKLGLV